MKGRCKDGSCFVCEALQETFAFVEDMRVVFPGWPEERKGEVGQGWSRDGKKRLALEQRGRRLAKEGVA